MKTTGPDGILNEMVMYGSERLVRVILEVINLVRSESSRQTGRGVCWYISTRMVTVRKWKL